MSTQHDRAEKMRRHLEGLSPQEHESIYLRFLSALFINEDGGHTKQAAFTRRQIEGLLSFGKIPPERQAELKRQARKSTQESLAVVQEVLWGARLGAPLGLYKK